MRPDIGAVTVEHEHAPGAQGRAHPVRDHHQRARAAMKTNMRSADTMPPNESRTSSA
jgi:hypothetical protein